jgi:succinoglycan biosynthesis protein ExoA
VSALAVVPDPSRAPVSVVMVVRDEPLERVRRVAAAVAAQVGTGPLDLVIAAPSADHEALSTLRPEGAIDTIALVTNEGGERSPGLNAAFDAATSDIVVRMDARSTLPVDHVATCTRLLRLDPRIGVVGGVQWPTATDESATARGAARALRNPWLLGGASYRRRGRSGAVDTVYLGAFRRDEVVGLGGYDTRLAANEDFELCERYRDAGFTVWLDGDLVVAYEARPNPAELFGQYRAFGASKVRFWRSTGRRPNRRQQVALGAAVLAGGLAVVACRRPRVAGALVAAGLVTLVAVDHAADPAEADLAVRAGACVSSFAVVAGWLAGITEEWVRGWVR